MDKRFLGILGGIIIVFIAIFAISQNSNNSSGGSGSGNAQATNHVEGNNSKDVTLVEYGDYECPICGAYYQPLKDAVAQYTNDIHFQFRNLPLTSIHKNALAGARAAEAASLQGKFWEMHDKLYENQDRTGASGWIVSNDPLDEYFVNFAKQIGVKDIDKFKTDYASEKVNDTINADLSAFGKTNQEMATPTFFLDGTYLPNTNLVDSQGNPSADKIGAALKAEIDKKSKQ